MTGGGISRPASLGMLEPCALVAGRGAVAAGEGVGGGGADVGVGADVGAGLPAEDGFSNLEATRAIGGSWGGKGDMGELETWLALSEKRGEPKYSVACEGDGSGYAAGLGWRCECELQLEVELGLATGSGDARLEALRFAWPGLRYENIWGAMMAAGDSTSTEGGYFSLSARPYTRQHHDATTRQGGGRAKTARRKCWRCRVVWRKIALDYQGSCDKARHCTSASATLSSTHFSTSSINTMHNCIIFCRHSSIISSRTFKRHLRDSSSQNTSINVAITPVLHHDSPSPLMPSLLTHDPSSPTFSASPSASSPFAPYPC